jgi:fatty-acyl-CoA synthase
MLKPGMSATAEEIQGFCCQQIAHHKIPRYVRFVTEFPMTVTGKAQKFVMREQMRALLALDSDPPVVPASDCRSAP